jgi:predicted O-methyltransferase YrrM
LTYAHELADLATPSTERLAFRLVNGSFESGDAEFLYQLIRARKPRRIFEIGSGNSTLMARRAILRNRQEQADYVCKHVCIEPFEAPWLESAGVITVRKKVEDVERGLFQELESGDLLFIDSSHMIRPQGDVLVEYLQILPTLKPGVLVHVHDVFTPCDYPREWLLDKMLLWNEQYLLEAFLTENESWRIIGALNLLSRRYFNQLRAVCPFLTPDRQPGSFYMQKLE